MTEEPRKVGVNSTKTFTSTLAGRVSHAFGVFWSACSRRALVAVAVLGGCTIFSASAWAACGPSSTAKVTVVLPDSQLFHTREVEQASSQATRNGDHTAAIAGLWDSKFVLPDGTLYDEGFDQFHSDGTEILSDNGVPPVLGDVCLGVFKKTSIRTYQLKHPAWNWDENGNLIGTIVLRETITLDAGGNSYHGSFTFDFYDLSGNLTSEVTGALTAQRITPD